MISYIKGTITFKTPTYVVVEAAGIGYHINISLNTYSKIEKEENVKLLTHLHIREDSHTLYGFADDLERDTFLKLISVSGIGTSTAQVILSSMTAEETRNAIVANDVQAFKKVKGVGPKTAQRVILDLKDKVVKDSGETSLTFTSQNNTLRDEALQGLLALGFNKIAIQKALNQVLKEQKDIQQVEDLIKAALKKMTS